MKHLLAIGWIIFGCISTLDAGPLLFFPEHLLPRSGVTFNYTFNGMFTNLNVSGVYTLQPVLDETTSTIIGYRNWQSYVGEFTGIFYGVSYLNGTYPQALIDPDTQQCINVFSEAINCTDWLKTDAARWDSVCSIVRPGTPITGVMANSVRTDVPDRRSLMSYASLLRFGDPPETATVSFDFLTRTESTSFANVKCDF